MTIKGKPQIIEAQRIADRIGAEAVVILAFGGENVAGASYGVTKANCAGAGQWMEWLIRRMESAHLQAPHLPDEHKR